MENEKLEAILLKLGFVTKTQLFDATIEAKKNFLPIGMVLIQSNIITNEQLKQALKELYGDYETMSDDDLNISDDVLSIFPIDYIKMNKVIPICINKQSVIVGMLNPNDKKVINDIVFLTGFQPQIKLSTYFEFREFLKKYEEHVNKQQLNKESVNREYEKIEEEPAYQYDDNVVYPVHIKKSNSNIFIIIIIILIALLCFLLINKI